MKEDGYKIKVVGVVTILLMVVFIMARYGLKFWIWIKILLKENGDIAMTRQTLIGGDGDRFNLMNLYSWTAITNVFSENKSILTKKFQKRTDISIRVFKVSNVSVYEIH